MNRAEAIERLANHRTVLIAMGATALYLFGSTARDEAEPSSDVDLFIDYDPSTRFNAFDLIGIKHFLEARLDRSIDMATRDGLHPALRDTIERSAIRVF